MSVVDTLVSRDAFVLVVVDIQERLAAVMDRRDEVVAATSKLARAAALVGAPIVVTRQNPERLGGTVAELDELIGGLQRDGARVREVDKTAFCCGAEPVFARVIEDLARPQVVIAGMESHICVTQTALALVADGRQVHVVADACCSRRKPDHETALRRMGGAGVIVTTSESVMYEAVGRAATDEFRELLRIVKE